MWLFNKSSYTIVSALAACAAAFCIVPAYTSAVDITTPFLYLPFSYKHYRTFDITEAWWYSWSTGYLATIGSGEMAIHGLALHKAIDYALPYGTPVLAPMDGYLIASYHNAFLKSKGYVKQYQNVSLHYGLGWFVQIWNPSRDIFVTLGHLSSIDETLPVSPPYPTRGKTSITRRDPTGVTYDSGSLQTMINDPITYPWVVYVKRWQRIGTVGRSWVEWDNAMIQEISIPRAPLVEQQVSRDEPHIHLEVFTVQDGKKALLDPYGMYRDARGYPDSKVNRKSLENTLFVKSKTGRIRFADEK